MFYHLQKTFFRSILLLFVISRDLIFKVAICVTGIDCEKSCIRKRRASLLLVGGRLILKFVIFFVYNISQLSGARSEK